MTLPPQASFIPPDSKRSVLASVFNPAAVLAYVLPVVASWVVCAALAAMTSGLLPEIIISNWRIVAPKPQELETRDVWLILTAVIIMVTASVWGLAGAFYAYLLSALGHPVTAWRCLALFWSRPGRALIVVLAALVATLGIAIGSVVLVAFVGLTFVPYWIILGFLLVVPVGIAPNLAAWMLRIPKRGEQGYTVLYARYRTEQLSGMRGRQGFGPRFLLIFLLCAVVGVGGSLYATTEGAVLSLTYPVVIPLLSAGITLWIVRLTLGPASFLMAEQSESKSYGVKSVGRSAESRESGANTVAVVQRSASTPPRKKLQLTIAIFALISFGLAQVAFVLTNPMGLSRVATRVVTPPAADGDNRKRSDGEVAVSYHSVDLAADTTFFWGQEYLSSDLWYRTCSDTECSPQLNTYWDRGFSAIAKDDALITAQWTSHDDAAPSVTLDISTVNPAPIPSPEDAPVDEDDRSILLEDREPDQTLDRVLGLSESGMLTWNYSEEYFAVEVLAGPQGPIIVSVSPRFSAKNEINDAELAVYRCADVACATYSKDAVALGAPWEQSEGGAGINSVLREDGTVFVSLLSSLGEVQLVTARTDSDIQFETLNDESGDWYDSTRGLSVELNAEGFPVLFWRDITKNVISFVTCRDDRCESRDREDHASSPEPYSFRLDRLLASQWAIDETGRPMFVDMNDDQSVVVINSCDDATCQSFTSKPIAVPPNERVALTLMLSDDGRPIVLMSTAGRYGQVIRIECLDARCGA